jgi:NADPH:quinone reductase-like Zn-dependent oxidoreductase
MQAIVCEKYGSPDVLELKEVAKPIPKDDEVLVSVQAAALNAADWHFLRGEPIFMRLVSGLFRPKVKILGADIAGQVEAVGTQVNQFKVGDDVFGDISDSGWGAFAEYVCVSQKALVLKPANMTYDEAAAIPFASVTALQGLRDNGKIESGQQVLINGASGGVGTFAVQLAKSFGTEVTAVCSSRNLDMALSIGADHVIDYNKEDFTHKSQRYDLIMGVNGFHPISAYKRALRPNGTYVLAGGSGAQIFQGLFLGPILSIAGHKKLRNYVAKPKQDDLAFIKELVEVDKIKPVIDRKYPLSEVPEAIRYLENGHARGKVVIQIGSVIR